MMAICCQCPAYCDRDSSDHDEGMGPKHREGRYSRMPRHIPDKIGMGIAQKNNSSIQRPTHPSHPPPFG